MGHSRMLWIGLLGAALVGQETALRFSWQEPHAKVLPTGDLEWAPQPFRFVPGDSVRYIDFGSGRDANDGASKATPWRHHPWDAAATGRAKACTGVHTYVFKGGVHYRGELTVREGGRPGEPVVLTRDPAWGEGDAVLCGSEEVTGWRQGADREDIPEPAKVWHADLGFAPRSLWMVRPNGECVRIPLARMPNWKVSDPDDVKAEWWSWDMPPPLKWFGNTVAVGRQKVHLAGDSVHVKGRPRELFEGAVIYPEHGWVIGKPYPTRVMHVDAEQGTLGFGGRTGDGSGGGVIMRGMRYYLEDKPQYLDDPDGEFWFDRKGDGGRLYLRLPGDTDPATVRIEAARRGVLVGGTKVEHLHVSGLSFRFTGPVWDLTTVYWDFSAKPWRLRPERHPASVRVWGEGRDVRVTNCRFEHVVAGIHIRALERGMRVDDVLVADNEFRHTDDSAIVVGDGAFWGYSQLAGRLGDVRILRNRAVETGARPGRLHLGTTLAVEHPLTAEIAGNVLERSYAQGIDVLGAKRSGCWGDVPLSRILIHHNKVWESMLDANDYGGIETWQGGPTYVYGNLSHHAQGLKRYEQTVHGSNAGFGHAYYLDGAFKNYHFHNIAWGRSNDPTQPTVNCAAFQEIHGYQNTFFHNTAYNYCIGSRRQAPRAGRNKYLANLWSSMSEQVFRHGEPVRVSGGGNAADVGGGTGLYALETNAYAGNVFHDFAKLGCVEPFVGKGWNTPEEGLLDLAAFRAALARNGSIAAELGGVAPEAPLRDPANHDFRPTPAEVPGGRGAKVFVPWALSGVVAEWNFYRAGDDPARIIDEHWYMTDYLVDRTEYHRRPTYPLTAVNVTAGDYVPGPLEDWVAGALRFAPGKRQYARLANERMMRPFSFRAARLSKHEGGKPEDCTVSGEALRNPQIHGGNFLVEACFRATPPQAEAVLIEKRKGSGYGLSLDAQGRAVLSIAGGGRAARLASQATVADGKWHHLIAEADRTKGTLALYVDGKLDATGPGLGASGSLANEGDLFVGGTPDGRHLDGALDFLRIAHGTLADARTTIEELYAWEFDGPFLRDFAGRKPRPGQRRPPGALLGE